MSTSLNHYHPLLKGILQGLLGKPGRPGYQPASEPVFQDEDTPHRPDMLTKQQLQDLDDWLGIDEDADGMVERFRILTTFVGWDLAAASKLSYLVRTRYHGLGGPYVISKIVHHVMDRRDLVRTRSDGDWGPLTFAIVGMQAMQVFLPKMEMEGWDEPSEKLKKTMDVLHMREPVPSVEQQEYAKDTPKRR